jgi:predicted transcriptional regulator
MLSHKRRDRLTIMAQILNIAREGTLKTQIMYRANLSFAQLNEYLSFLQEIRLLKVNSEDGRTTYKTTSKGIKYLENFSKIKDLLRKTHQHNPGEIHSNRSAYFL